MRNPNYPRNPAENGDDLFLQDLMTHEQLAEREGREVVSEIYTFSVSAGDRSIFYFGADHIRHPGDPMFEQIKEEFKKTSPDMVLVEGNEWINGQDPEELKEYSGKHSGAGMINEFGEPGFAIRLALEHGVPVESPEPSLHDEITSLLAQGFSEEDVFLYYIARDVNQYARIPQKPPLKEYLKPYLEGLEEDTRWKDFDFSIEHFGRLAKEKWGIEGLGSVDEKFFARRVDPVPWKGTEKEFGTTNKIAQESSTFRDRYMLKRIAELLKEKKRIFIVYGSSHARMQEPALRTLMKKYENI